MTFLSAFDKILKVLYLQEYIFIFPLFSNIPFFYLSFIEKSIIIMKVIMISLQKV